MDLGIKGRVAIVTGGSRGIGRETARQFLEEGARVMISGRNAETLEKTRADLAKQTGGDIKCVVADMVKEADIKKLVDQVNREDMWRTAAKAIGVKAADIPASTSRGKETFFDGKVFDPEAPEAYLKSLDIKRMA